MRVAVGGEDDLLCGDDAAGRCESELAAFAGDGLDARAFIQLGPASNREAAQRVRPLHRVEQSAMGLRAGAEERSGAHALGNLRRIEPLEAFRADRMEELDLVLDALFISRRGRDLEKARALEIAIDLVLFDH